MAGIAIYYHPDSQQAGGGVSCSSGPRMDILMPSLRSVPHFSSSCRSCKPTDDYIRTLHLGALHGARISGAVASRTIRLGVS